MMRPAVSLSETLWMRVRQGIVVLAVLVLTLPTMAWAQKVPVGSEFQINAYSTGNQGYWRGGDIASDDEGNFVVVWHDSDSQLYGRQFTSDGVPLGPEAKLTTSYAGRPQVASDAVGNFVVVWHSYDCDGWEGMCVRQFDSTGTPRGSEFRVTDSPYVYAYEPRVASNAAGDFVVVWENDAYIDYEWEYGHVFARRFDSNGTPLGQEFQVTTGYSPHCCRGDYGENSQSGVQVASDAAGNFMVVWNQNTYTDYYGYPYLSHHSISGRIFDDAGVPAGPDFEIDDQGYQKQAAVAADGAGHFIVVWESYDGDGGTFGQRFDTTGTLVGAEFQVNEDEWCDPKVAADAAGNFVVVWAESYQASDYDGGVFGLQFDSTGAALGSPFLVNTYTTSYQRRAEVASAANGDFVVIWASTYQDGDRDGLFGQRFGEAGSTTTTTVPTTTTTTLPPATEHLIPTKIGLVKFGGSPPEGRLYKLVSKAPNPPLFTLPASSPATTGGMLAVTMTGGELTCDLQAGAWDGSRGWKELGNPAGSKGYKYINKGAPGNNPCKIVILKEKVIKVLAKGTGTLPVPLDYPPPPGNPSILTVLSLGTDNYCALWVAPHHKEKADKLIKAKGQDPPASCAGPAPAG